MPKGKTQRQEPTLGDIAGVLGRLAEAMDGINTRLIAVEQGSVGQAQTPVALAPKTRKQAPQVSTLDPERREVPQDSAEVNTLRGQCSPSAQRTVESKFRQGAKAFDAYLAKLADLSPNFGGTNRTRYALALLAHSGKSTKGRKGK